MSTVTDEAQRLAAVRRYEVLDTPPDGAFERITSLAARLFDVPISIVSIVDADRIWFKSHHGVDAEQVDREPGLCASAVLQSGPWLVNDARNGPAHPGQSAGRSASWGCSSTPACRRPPTTGTTWARGASSTSSRVN